MTAAALRAASWRASARPPPHAWPMGIAALGWVVMACHAFAGTHVCCAGSPGAEWRAWMAMVAAMMVPTLGDALRDVALRSYRVRRDRAVALYLAGYLSVWALVGAGVAMLRQWPAARAPWVPVAAFAFGTLWTLVPARSVWLGWCHRRVALAPAGLRADGDALRQGVVNGAPCVATCWPVMVGCALAGHAPVVMVAGAALTLAEKRMYFPRPRLLATGVAALAAWVALAPGW